MLFLWGIKGGLKKSKMDVEELSIRELKEIRNLFDGKMDNPFDVGSNYFIRTVTMSLVGKLVRVGQQELVLEDAAWIADTGRFADFLESGEASEIEPFPPGEVILGRSSIIDAVKWSHKLPRKQK